MNCILTLSRLCFHFYFHISLWSPLVKLFKYMVIYHWVGSSIDFDLSDRLSPCGNLILKSRWGPNDPCKNTQKWKLLFMRKKRLQAKYKMLSGCQWKTTHLQSTGNLGSVIFSPNLPRGQLLWKEENRKVTELKLRQVYYWRIGESLARRKEDSRGSQSTRSRSFTLGWPYNLSSRGAPLRIKGRDSWWLGFPGGSAVQNLPANAGSVGSIPGLRRSPGEWNGNPLQYSCLGNPMNRGACGLQSMGSQKSHKT